MSLNRRDDRRVPVQTYLNEYLGDRLSRGMITNVSERGLRVQRLNRPLHRSSRIVQLEFELPGTGETIWAKGEACFDELELTPFGASGEGPVATIHSSGIHMLAMATRHARLMRDYVIERRRVHLKDALARMTRRRYH
ncbi:MAG: PilZ domain-containing protein [Myxococcales bacterium]|nr:PilZ domain-containing protein [Myxococcales bacterium]